MKYCPLCATELVRRIESGRERPVCPRCGYVAYRNPVPVALVLVTREDRLLLVHRRHAPLAGYWAPPAGYVEIDESLEEGAAREVKEETGLDIVVDRLLTVYSRANVGVMLVTFAAHAHGGTLAPQAEEVDDLRFFAPTEIPFAPPPVGGKPLDGWFYQVLDSLYRGIRDKRTV